MAGPVKQQLGQQSRRIGIAADSHGDWAGLDAWAMEHALDVVVHCGDCGTTASAGTPVWAARGNHDPDSPFDPHDSPREDSRHSPRAGDLVAARPRFVDDYHVLDLGGLRWLFLGCAPGTARVAAVPEDALASGVDVLVSHEAPFNPHTGWPGHVTVRALVERLQPRWCFSGHWHRAARATVGRTRCFALGTDPSGWLVATVGGGDLHLLDVAGPPGGAVAHWP